jgi:hypothetical protein
MDEMDRMFRRLVHNVRAGFPDLLTRSFEVSSLYQTLIPYRLNRTELGIDSSEEYELALIRLLAGTRGLLNGDPDMQMAIQSELESPNPDLSIFRAWATAKVSINANAVRALDSQSTTAIRTPTPAVTTRQAAMAGLPTLEVATAIGAAASSPVASSATRTAAPVATPPESAAATAQPLTVTSNGHGPGCRYCGSELPDGRDAHFCPHCGQNLSVKQCPACSTELEVEWQFCITCGRQVE